MSSTLGNSNNEGELVQRSGGGSNAFSNDINACLFQRWLTALTPSVLEKPVDCHGAQLCYRVNPSTPTQFAVCYNTHTRIADFTGHVVQPRPPGLTTPKTNPGFSDETGRYGKKRYRPNPNKVDELRTN